jgi:uncharacterized membrane protein YfbV (UPF0208 family)
MEKRLAPVFVENRVIRMTRYAIRFMPPIAVFTLCWQIALGDSWDRPWRPRCLRSACRCRACGGWVNVPHAAAAFNTQLVLRSSVNCKKPGRRSSPVEGKPDYQALADTLKRAFKQLDKTFLDDL